MFETSLMESSGKLRSKSSRYLWLTGSFNVAVVGVMVLLPLLYPEALPHAALTAVLAAPPPPPAAPSRPAVAHASPVRQVAAMNAFVAPMHVPARIDLRADDPPVTVAGVSLSDMGGTRGAGLGPVGSLGLAVSPPLVTVAVPKASARVSVSSGVIAGSKLSGVSPVYPAIAKAAHVSGAVVLRAVISKTGDIESLSVVSGPEMLRSSAVGAVQGWKYRPYLLNGQPTEVDTTVVVNFAFGG